MGRASEQRRGADGSVGIDPKMEQTETPIIVKGKSHVDNVVQIYTKMKSVDATQVAAQPSLWSAKRTHPWWWKQ